MSTVNFLYRSKNESAPLNVRLLFRHNSKDYQIGGRVKYEVTKDYWKSHFKKNLKDPDLENRQLEVNTELVKIKTHILSEFKATNPDDIDKKWLTNTIDKYYNPPEKVDVPDGLVSFIDMYLDAKKNLTYNTRKKIVTVRNQVIAYQNERNEIIQVSGVNGQFRNSFENYMIENHYGNNTIAVALKFIQTVCAYAHDDFGVEIHNLKKMKKKWEKVDSIYLTFDELDKIEKVKLNDKLLEDARDWLIISSYSGQRVSDFMDFNKDQISFRKNKEGELKPLIEFTQKKTGKIMTIPLGEKVMEMLEKRGGDFPCKMPDQKYNRRIKTVCKKAGLTEQISGGKMTEVVKDGTIIKAKNGKSVWRKEKGIFPKWELVTSHIGRRSFATNYYGIVPTAILIRITGHSTEQQFLSYIGKADNDLALQGANYF